LYVTTSALVLERESEFEGTVTMYSDPGRLTVRLLANSGFGSADGGGEVLTSWNVPSVNARYAYTLALAPSAISDCTTVADAVSCAVLLGRAAVLMATAAPVITYARRPATVASVLTTVRALDTPPQRR
jgi:hypothetical protein